MEVNIKEYKKKIIGLYWKNRYVNMYIQIDRQEDRDIKIVVIVEKNEQDDEEEKCVYTI